MSYENEENTTVEVIDASKSEHETDYVSNVVYGPVTKKDAKKIKERDEAFYAWAKGLSPNRDTMTETHHFEYRRHTINDKGKQTDY